MQSDDFVSSSPPEAFCCTVLLRRLRGTIFVRARCWRWFGRHRRRWWPHNITSSSSSTLDEAILQLDKVQSQAGISFCLDSHLLHLAFRSQQIVYLFSLKSFPRGSWKILLSSGGLIVRSRTTIRWSEFIEG